MDEFTKQIYESFTIAADFSKNMITGETISSQTVVAIDKNDLDVSTVVLDQTTVANDGLDRVSVLVRAGAEDVQPYKITFKAVTSRGHQWELDIKMKIKEI